MLETVSPSSPVTVTPGASGSMFGGNRCFGNKQIYSAEFRIPYEGVKAATLWHCSQIPLEEYSGYSAERAASLVDPCFLAPGSSAWVQMVLLVFRKIITVFFLTAAG